MDDVDPGSYPALLSPFQLGPLRLRNRVAHASISLAAGAGGRVGALLVQYHVNRARGGVALTVSEPLGTVPQQARLPRPQVWNDEDFDGLRRWAGAVGEAGAHLVGQVQDAGRGRHYPGRTADAVGASVLPDDLSWTVPRALTAAEIGEYVAHVAGSARRLQRAGFAGIELSCGHGHLFHQFLSPWMNRREDGYGGDRVGRVRFVAEMVRAVRAACGAGFVIGLKLPGDDGVAGSIDAAEAFAITRALVSEGPDYVGYAWGSHSRTLEMHVPDRFGERLPYAARLRALRGALGGVPLMSMGRITDPAEAEALVRDGDAELVGLGRALIADPAFLLKAARGRAHDIRYCLSCNTCWGQIITSGRPIACVNNPRVGAADEVDFWPEPAGVARRVVVVGAGVAGLEAAWVAGARGHDVTVFGRGPAAGGKALVRAPLPGGETITSIPDYQVPAALRAGVRFVLGREAGLEEVLAARPDVVVLATGGTMIAPDWLPDDMRDLVPDLRAAMAGLVGVRGRQAGVAVVFDMDQSEGVYAAALHLAGVFQGVVIVTPRDTIGFELHLMVRQGVVRRVAQAGVRVVVNAVPVWTDEVFEGGLAVENVFTGAREVIGGVALVTYATPRAPAVGLEAGLAAAGIEVVRVGDAAVGGELLAATASGHAAGMGV